LQFSDSDHGIAGFQRLIQCCDTAGFEAVQHVDEYFCGRDGITKRGVAANDLNSLALRNGV